MQTTRRTLLRGSALTLASAFVPQHVYANRGYVPDVVNTIQDPKLKQLIQTAVDAAISAGASYADARLTFSQILFGIATNPIRTETMGFGVRALYDGYWGFASSPVWTSHEAGRLGKSAAQHARANVLGSPRDVEFAPLATPTSGHWIMPIQEDPFEMAYEEIADFMGGIRLFINGLEGARHDQTSCLFLRQEKAFGSSVGQFTTQRLYRTGGIVRWMREGMGVSLDCLTPAGLGFEYLRDQPLRRYIEEAHEEAKRVSLLSVLPVDVGRYTTLIDAQCVATTLSQTVGVATELDRAMGFEANGSGSSYITAPDEMLGTLRVGNTMLNVTANRSEPGAVGRVRWDDEGVEPKTFPLITQGVLANMQTNREAAGWVKSHYSKTGQSWSSFGCAYAPDAFDVPLVHSADLHLTPSSDPNASLDTLRRTIEKGIEWKNPTITMDFQQMTGFVRGQAFLIRNGQRSALVLDAGMLFRTSELWGNITHLGGAASVRRFGLYATKGEPAQRGCHSVTAPPAIVKEMTVIDIKRKA